MLQFVEFPCPEALVVAHPLRDFAQRRPPEFDEVLAADHLAPDEPRILEDLQVLGDGVERHLERLGDLGHALRALRQAIQDRPAGGVGDRAEDVAQVVHAFHSTRWLNVCQGELFTGAFLLWTRRWPMKIVSSRTAGRMLVGFAAAVGLACATLAIAQAPTIAINVKNNTGQDYVVHVYELFAGENREVRGSP